MTNSATLEAPQEGFGLFVVRLPGEERLQLGPRTGAEQREEAVRLFTARTLEALPPAYRQTIGSSLRVVTGDTADVRDAIAPMLAFHVDPEAIAIAATIAASSTFSDTTASPMFRSSTRRSLPSWTFLS